MINQCVMAEWQPCSSMCTIKPFDGDKDVFSLVNIVGGSTMSRQTQKWLPLLLLEMLVEELASLQHGPLDLLIHLRITDVTPDRPAVPHGGKLDDGQLVSKHFLAEAARSDILNHATSRPDRLMVYTHASSSTL